VLTSIGIHTHICPWASVGVNVPANLLAAEQHAAVQYATQRQEPVKTFWWQFPIVSKIPHCLVGIPFSNVWLVVLSIAVVYIGELWGQLVPLPWPIIRMAMACVHWNLPPDIW
jgi:hypothetical protein